MKSLHACMCSGLQGREELLAWQAPAGTGVSCASVQPGLVLLSCAKLLQLTALAFVHDAASQSPCASWSLICAALCLTATWHTLPCLLCFSEVHAQSCYFGVSEGPQHPRFQSEGFPAL